MKKYRDARHGGWLKSRYHQKVLKMQQKQKRILTRDEKEDVLDSIYLLGR